MTQIPIPINVCGKIFFNEDIEIIRTIIKNNPKAHHNEISRIIFGYKPLHGAQSGILFHKQKE